MRRFFLIVVGVLAALAATPAFGQADFAEWERRMLAGEYASAATMAQGVAELHVESAVWAYRTAASLAMAGNSGQAVEWLGSAGERGYSGVRTVETDSDIDSIRGHAGYAKAAETIKQNAAARIGRFKQAASEAEPIIVRPRGFDKTEPTPVLLVLHGSGGTGRGMEKAWRRVAARAGAVLIAPDALRPWGDGYGWTFRDETEWYVEHLIDEARGSFAVGPVVVAGFSQGANTALSMGRSHPGLFDAVIAVSGHWQDDTAAMPAGGDGGPRWYLLIGEEDPWVETYDEGRESLTGAGMAVELRKVPRLGHALPGRRELEEAMEWCLEE